MKMRHILETKDGAATNRATRTGAPYAPAHGAASTTHGKHRGISSRRRLETDMEKTSQGSAIHMEDIRILTYVQHMAQTAKSDEGKRIFKAYLEQESRRHHRSTQRLDAGTQA
jgi:hypothetical protein